jgi:ubiquinone biosynthesis protein COQ9
MTFDRDAVREQILMAALPHVPFDGWSDALLRNAAKEAGHDATMALRVFPRGAVEAVEAWVALADRRMVEALERHGTTGLKTREKIALAIRLRLEALAQHREAVRRAVGLLALPLNAPVGAATLWRTVDAIWYAAGDTATDFNFYTKRGLLAGVYSATLFHWLDDKSEGFENTWAFLDRRLSDVLRVPQALGRLRERLPDLSQFLRGFAARR